MHKAFKYRLYPTKAQTQQLEETCETVRRLWNTALEARRVAYEQDGKSPNYIAQCYSLTEWRKTNPYLQRVSVVAARGTLHSLDLAFKAFFRRVKAGQKPGYPRWKKPGEAASLVYRQYGSGVSVRGDRLHLQYVGEIKMEFHRPLAGTPKTVTMRKEAGRWFVSIVCECEAQPLPATGNSAGVDMGLEHFATTSDGEMFENPRYLRQAEQTLKRLQRQVSRRKKGSNRRKKAVAELAQAHWHVANQRRDNAHKVARSLVNEYDLIAVEDLQVKNMLQNEHLSKSIADAGWSQFLTILDQKGEEAGRTVTRVAPQGTSQMCSSCGATVKKPLSQRTHKCPSCGLVLHRDINAALNILDKAAG